MKTKSGCVFWTLFFVALIIFLFIINWKVMLITLGLIALCIVVLIPRVQKEISNDDYYDYY